MPMAISLGLGLGLSGQGGLRPSFGFVFLRMAVVEGGHQIIVQASIVDGGPLKKIQVKES